MCGACRSAGGLPAQPWLRQAFAKRLAYAQPMAACSVRCTTWRFVIAAVVGLSFAVSLRHAPARSGAPLTARNVRVVDGDTLVLDKTRIRLEGIDAPETGQTCNRKGSGTWPCGAAASAELARLLRGNAVSCEPHGQDKYGRTLAVCFADGRNVNAQMVRQGYAWAFVRYSRRYVAEEAAAKRDGIGIWQGDAVPAWEYRAQHRLRAPAQAQQAQAQQTEAQQAEAEHAGCSIKGNVSGGGRIYHMPSSPWYGQIRMQLARGKRWFCSEADAVAAGWRPVQAR
jgi:endonuclease YncB( thermonuclease family)